MDLSLFLNSLLEFYLSFGLDYLYDNLSIISILVLSLVIFFFIYFVEIPSIPNVQKNEHSQKVRNPEWEFNGTPIEFFIVVAIWIPTFLNEFDWVRERPKLGRLRREQNITLLGEETRQGYGFREDSGFHLKLTDHLGVVTGFCLQIQWFPRPGSSYLETWGSL